MKRFFLLAVTVVSLVLICAAPAFADDKGDKEKVEEYLEKGNDYAASGDMDKAMSEFKKALEVDPGNPLAHNNMGIIYKNKGLYTTAIEEFKLALEGMPNYYKTYNNLGNIYFEREYYDEAEKYYQKCIKVKPDFAECYWNLALCCEASGQYDKATRYFSKYKELSNDPAYVGLAQQHIDEIAERSEDDEDL